MKYKERKYSHECDTLGAYRRFALRAAEELFYGPEIIQKVKDAKTMEEISRIMTSARMTME